MLLRMGPQSVEEAHSVNCCSEREDLHVPAHICGGVGRMGTSLEFG